MAKKVVATLKDKSKANAVTKVVMAVKNKETGSYSFRQEIIPSDNVQEYIKKNKG